MKLNSWPYYDNEQLEIVSRILKSGNVNYLYGNEGKTFEREFSSFCGVNYSVCFSNGTTALYAAYKAINLGNDDEIITTPRTFIATVAAAVELGAKPIFADIDINSGCITLESIEPLITKKTKAISVVHLAGWPAEMEKISKLAKEKNLFLIEDCSQAHGAFIDGKSVGSFGDISVWSFCTDKIISTGGEGGMLCTNSKEIYKKTWSFKDHGKSIQKFNKSQDDFQFNYIHDEIGLNFRMTEMQSAIGRYQLKNLKEFNNLRTKNAQILKKYLENINSLRVPMPNNKLIHGFYKFYAYLKPQTLRSDWDRSEIIKYIREKGYPCYTGSCSEVYLESCFKKRGLAPNKRLKNAKELGETSLMFLVHPTINEFQMNAYSETIRSVLIKATQ